MFEVPKSVRSYITTRSFGRSCMCMAEMPMLGRRTDHDPPAAGHTGVWTRIITTKRRQAENVLITTIKQTGHNVLSCRASTEKVNCRLAYGQGLKVVELGIRYSFGRLTSSEYSELLGEYSDSNGNNKIKN
ncbi:hypothetical protein LXL04_008808 [Taraxacum kok-saghyz]